MVALEPQPIKPKIAFGTIDGFNEVEGVASIPIVALVEATKHFYGITNSTLFHTIAKYESKYGDKYWYGKKDFDFGTTRTYCDPTTTAPRIHIIIIDPRVDVMLEELKVANMEE